MNKLTFESIYKKLSKNTKALNQSDMENILKNDKDYYTNKKSKEEKFKEFEVKIKEKKYGNISYGAYMYRHLIIKDFIFDENYNLIDQPDEYCYEASMLAVKEDKSGTYSIDHILAIRDKNKDKVQERYDYICSILDSYEESQLLDIINTEIDKQITKDKK